MVTISDPLEKYALHDIHIAIQKVPVLLGKNYVWNPPPPGRAETKSVDSMTIWVDKHHDVIKN